MGVEGIDYVEMPDDRHDGAVLEMMNALYKEDQATAPHDPQGFARTLICSVAHPKRSGI